MNKLKISSISLIIGLLFSLDSFSQKTITLKTNLLDRTYDYVARDYITLEPGFKYTAGSATTFTARVDDKLICLVDFVENPEPGTSRPLETTLKEVGSIPGSYSVSPSGAATYSFPIELPPGVSGMVPSFGISYNSQAGNGILGKGWNLSGISYITRGTKSLLQDSTINTVTLDNNNDRFFLDGQRLICVNGTYGSSNSEYKTEIDNLSKVQLLSGTDGKLYFNVQTPQGRVLKYQEKVEITTGIVFWALKEMSDLDGNTITYNYRTYGNKLYIDNMEYSNTKIEFYYGGRNGDNNFSYQFGVKFTDDIILEKIKVTTDGTTFREYDFSYTKGLSSLLYDISVSSGDGSQLNSTRVDWTSSSLTYNAQSLSEVAQKKNMKYGDFNGDGRTDILTYSDIDNFCNVYINNNGDGSFTVKTIDKPTGFKNFEVGDFDNDGDDDIYISWVHQLGSIEGIEFDFVEYSGTQFVRNSSKDLSYVRTAKAESFNPFLIHADFNGDGEEDILIYDKYINNIYAFYTSKFSAKGGSLIEMSNFEGYPCIMNFNGNQKPDLLVVSNSQAYVYEYSNISNKFEQIYTSYNFENKAYQVGDFNGDGLSDLAPTMVGQTQSKMFYSTGKGFDVKYVPFTAPNDPLVDNDFAAVGVTDFNNDGKSDLLRLYNTVEEYVVENNEDDRTLWANIYINANTYISQGNNSFKEKGLFTKSLHSKRRLKGSYGHVEPIGDVTVVIDFDLEFANLIHFAYNNWIPKYTVQDFNSDGNGDLLLTLGGSLHRVSLVNGYKQELVKTITNGLNINTKFEYTTLYNSSVYRRTSSGVYLVYNILGPMYVVNRVDLYDNNSQNIARIDYEYINAKIHAEYGFLGFESTSSFNTFTNISSTTQNTIVGELHSLLPSSIVKRLNRARSISSIKIANNVVEYSAISSKYYQLRVTQKQSTDHLTATTVTTDYKNFNGFNQPEQIVEKYGVKDMVTTTDFTFSPDTSGDYWLPLRLSSTNVTKSRIFQTGIFSETTDFVYNDAANPYRLMSKVLRKNTDKEVTESYTYENFGGIKSVAISDGTNTRSTAYVYDPDNHKFVKEKTVNNTFPVKYTYNAFGNVLSQEDHNGNITRFNYNGFGELLNTTMHDGNTMTKSINFGTGGGPTETVYYITSTLTGKGSTKEFYNRRGQLLRKETPGALNKTYKTDYEYYADGKIYKQHLPYEATKDDFNAYSYDVYGRLVSQNTPQGTITNDFGPYGSKIIRITSPEGWTEKTFDNAGLVTIVKDEGGEINYFYNNMGLMSEIKYTEASSALTFPRESIEMVYVEKPPLTASAITISLDYDAAGNQIRVDDPNIGVSSMVYNRFGDLLSYTDSKGNNYSMIYDNFGRLESKTCNGENTTWTYNSESGVLDSFSNSEILTVYSYDDNWLHLEKQTETIDGQNFETSFTYNGNGDVATVNYPGGFGIENVYDNNGFRTQIKRAGTPTNIWTLNTVNDKGMITNFGYGNGISTTLAYDAHYKPSEIVTSNGSINHWTYQFNDAGNLDYRRNENLSVQENFDYDDLNRLTSYNDGTVYYNGNGNIISKPDIGTYGYNVSQRPHAVENITTPVASYNPVPASISYTSFDKVKEIIDNDNNYKQNLTYGPDQQRKMMKTYESGSLTQTKYYSGSYEKIVDLAKGTKELTYISTGSGLAAVFIKDFDNTEKLYYIHTDYLGSVMALTNESGAKVEEYFYDAWGQRKNPANWSQPETRNDLMIDRGYTGHEHWAHFDLINMNGRVYDPELGRFLSADPVFQSPAYSQNFNKYSYVLNNPFKYTDPSGYNPSPTYWEVNYGALGANNKRYDFSGANMRLDNYSADVIFNYNVNQFVKNTPDNGGGHYDMASGNIYYWDPLDSQAQSTGDDNAQSSGNGIEMVGMLPEGYSNVIFNIYKAAENITAHANYRSQGECSTNVQDALKAGGINTPNYYYAGGSYGPKLKGWGFTMISTTLENYTPVIGDVAVIQGYPGGTECRNGPCGHIQMYNGVQWVSDFFQTRPFWPGQTYENKSPSFEIYRWEY